MEDIQMLSAGIDIGTSTTQVVFSRLTVKNTAGYFSVPAVSIVKKEVVYQSPVYRTPLADRFMIDGDALEKIIVKEYMAADVTAGQVETGAVIITGESARKENARMILEQMSRFAGDFVVSTAGPDLESAIAGQGSGARAFSEENGAVVVNLDVGGGTTNIALFDNGELRAKGCLDIGGRHVTVDERGNISYVSPCARNLADARNLPLCEGEKASEEVLKMLCKAMCQILEQVLGITAMTALAEMAKTKGASLFRLSGDRPVRFLCFSGGVGDCVYEEGRPAFVYGDIGVLLGNAIRNSRLFQAFHVIKGRETIRATVIGAGSYATTVSGSTIICPEKLFPMKNVPVLKLSPEEEEKCWNGEEAFLYQKVRWFLEQNDAERMVLAFDGKDDPDYGALKQLAISVAEALHRALPKGAPLLLVMRADMAKALGQLVRRQLADRRQVAAVDAVKAEQNNFLDFGRPVMNGLVIPVVVKTLIFG